MCAGGRSLKSMGIRHDPWQLSYRSLKLMRRGADGRAIGDRFAAVHESGCGPPLPTCAVYEVVSFLRYCRRAGKTAAIAVLDP